MGIKLIIYDLDGTLLDISKRYTASYFLAFESIGLGFKKIDKKKIIAMKKSGCPGLEIIKYMAPNVDEGILTKINELRKKIVKETKLLDMDTPIPNLKNHLRKMKKQNIKLAILTSRQKRKTEQQLKRFSLLHYFDKILIKKGIDYVKEKCNGLRELLKEFGIKSECALFIGDTSYDIEAGRRVGVISVGVLSGLTDRHTLEKEGPDLIINNITKLKLGFLKRFKKIEEIPVCKNYID